MPRDAYRTELSTLRSDVTAMGDAVLAQLDDALDVLEPADASGPGDATGSVDLDGTLDRKGTAPSPGRNDRAARAQAVIEGDAAINDSYLDIEEACIDLFALQQPVASDLRFVTASFKIATDLERVGDLATNLANYAIADRHEWAPTLGVSRIGADARTMVADAVAAYRDEDVGACRAIAARDDRIDALCERASEQLVRELLAGDLIEDSWTLEVLLDDVSRLLLTIRDLERIADHAVNVAARTCYAVDGDRSLLA